MNKNDINKAYDELNRATGHYSAVELARINCKASLDNKVANALASGEVAGKNANERDANARSMFEDDFHALAVAETASHKAKTELDSASIEVSRLKMLMRLMEVTA